MKDMTEKQRAIWRAMMDSQSGRGRPATVREIAEAVGLASKNSVHEQLLRIAKKGYATNRGPGVSRSWSAHERRMSAQATAERSES